MHHLGHFANLSVTKIPESRKAFPIIEEYCKDLIYWPHYSAGDPELLTTSYQVARIAFFLNRTQFHPEILRSPLNTLLSYIPEYRRVADDISILPELLWALNGTHNQGALCGIRVLECVTKRFYWIPVLKLFFFYPVTSCKRCYPSMLLSLWTSLTSFAVLLFCYTRKEIFTMSHSLRAPSKTSLIFSRSTWVSNQATDLQISIGSYYL